MLLSKEIKEYTEKNLTVFPKKYRINKIYEYHKVYFAWNYHSHPKVDVRNPFKILFQIEI